MEEVNSSFYLPDADYPNQVLFESDQVFGTFDNELKILYGKF